MTSQQARRPCRMLLRGVPALAAALSLLPGCGGSTAPSVDDSPTALETDAPAVAPTDTTLSPAAAAPEGEPPAEAVAESSAASRVAIPGAGSTAGELDIVDQPGWLAAHQSRDGRFEVGGWHRWCMGDRVSGNGLTGLGSDRLDVAGTALAMLTYSNAGYTTASEGHVGPVMAWGIHALLYRQTEDGAFGDSTEPSWPVNHGLALFALTELAEARPEPRLIDAVVRGVARYHRSHADEEGRWTDRKAFGGLPPLAWIAFASQCATRATAAPEGTRPSATGIDTDPALARDRALVASWITLPVEERNLAMLGAGLALSVPHLEGGKAHPDVIAAATWLGERVPVWSATSEGVAFMGWWIATRGLHAAGGSSWQRWEAAIKTAVVDTQRRDGTTEEMKSTWDPVGVGAAEGGRLVTTLAGHLILEIWYRYDKVFGDLPKKAGKPARVAVPGATGPPPKGAARPPALTESSLPKRWYPPRRNQGPK